MVINPLFRAKWEIKNFQGYKFFVIEDACHHQESLKTQWLVVVI